MPLVLKNGFVLKRKRKPRKRVKERVAEVKHEVDVKKEVLDPVLCTGRIISSNTTVTGLDETKFTHEIEAGDILIIKHPTSLLEENRLVTIVVSDASLAVNAPFSTDLSTSIEFKIMKQTKEIEEKVVVESKTTSMTFRIRKTGKKSSGGYRTITKRFKKDEMSREELLNLRSKAKGDRYCM